MARAKIEVDLRIIKRAALTLRALHHPLRKKLLELIEAKGKSYCNRAFMQN